MIFIVGLILIFSSDSIGKSIAKNIIFNPNLIHAAAEMYYNIYYTYKIGFMIAGIIISLITGIVIILNGRILYRKTKKERENS